MKCWCLFVGWVLVHAGIGQTLDKGEKGVTAEASVIQGRSVADQNNNRVEGSPFALEQWGKGNVVLKNGGKLTGFDLQFNQHTNELWYALGGSPFTFIDTVLEARIEFSDGANPVWLTLRSQYPPIDGQNVTALYEVVEDGSTLHLLRFTKKEIVEGYTSGGAVGQTYKTSHTYYIFDVKDNRMYAIPAKLNWREMPLNLNVLTNQYTLGHGEPKKLNDWINMVRWINERP